MLRVLWENIDDEGYGEKMDMYMTWCWVVHNKMKKYKCKEILLIRGKGYVYRDREY